MIDLLFKILNKIFPLSLFSILKRYKVKVYSRWIKHEFGSCKAHCMFRGFKTLVGAEYMSIGEHVIVGDNVVFESYAKYGADKFNPHVEIGDGTSIGDDSHITCINCVKIGKNVLIGRKVMISDNAHGVSDFEQMNIHPLSRPLYSKGEVVIEDDVWIGEMACIMPGVRIGRGTVIGAGAVVTKSMPPYCVVGGVPAVVIKNMSSK